ncbi:flavin reductase family protein [Tengunoibacter tsumagoiensis]|uniref:Flavin reductase like domain-containing protein n=1 Tax=Tengunoibacter tsumagoiensis TaxID=2014871 RepID=A0A402A0I9_9CHLR|nr:flavin reductase family protein [Tengunoibacter tsumagoiensis]GCE12667.1 hypothetical protein KTT_25260 [Tengunoibacter tsumagoiensis]
MAMEKEFFRQVMGRFTTGVTVVTTSSQGQIAGITVNSFSSISLNPPLVMISIDINSHTIPLLRESKIFAVNILSAEQEHLSRGFATQSPERHEHFCHASYSTAATGAPIIDDVLAFVDTRIVAEYPAGDHSIFLGQVEAMGTGQRVVYENTSNITTNDEMRTEQHTIAADGQQSFQSELPLIYFQGKYRHLTVPYQTPDLSSEHAPISTAASH